MSSQHALDLTAKLQLAGRAIYRPKVWLEGNSYQGELVAQVYAEGDRDLPECAEYLGDVPLLTNDCQAESYAVLLSKAPEMLYTLKWAQTCFHGLIYAENSEEKAHYYQDAFHALGRINRAIALAEGRQT